MAAVGIQSRALYALPHLHAFFPEWQEIRLLSRIRPDTQGLTHIAGWGHKAPGLRAKKLAAEQALPYLALEDGFLRSYGLAVRGAAPWSLVVDDLGIYYDASTPSRLERLIAEAPPATAEAEALLQRMRDTQLSKYNTGARVLPPAMAALTQPYVLLIDQCVGDASLPLGYASEESFRRMLADAMRRHPGAPLVVKIHPDVVSGAREGYLARMTLPPHTIRITQDIHPALLFAQAREVHTATSLLGMEALIAGVPVVCHGAPFYAGWGLTDDHGLPEHVAARRQARPGLAQLFDAAYRRYARYIDPRTGAASDLATTIDQLAALSAQDAGRPAHVHGWGFSRWKRPHVAPFLTGPGGQVTHHRSMKKALAAAAAEGTALAFWASKETPALVAEAAAQGVALLRVEDGFLRSAGLGSDLIAAHSLVVDPLGIYYDATRPSQLEQWLEEGDFPAPLLARAATLRDTILAAGISKYNLGGVAPTLPNDRPIHLVVGQVEEDASIAQGGVHINTNAALLEAVRAAHPDAYLVYKPHPDVLAGNRRRGAADRDPARYADQVVTDAPIGALLPRVAALHTITSLAGFEMLLRGGKVVTYGHPFYAGWGLTEDKAGPHPRRTRRATLDELVAAALIRYPRYYDWAHGLPSTPEACVTALATAPRGTPPRLRQARRLLRWLKGRLA